MSAKDTHNPATAHDAHGGFIASIEGMRAIAVLAVLLFHLDIPLAAGGYLGVDLFFVISGFIITRNILGDMQRQRFILGEFYVRRFRRLFPALLVTVCLTLLVGAWLMPPAELQATAVSALYALFSLSNVHFWLEAGYFDAAAQARPLLHTWSLGVEEQFYLLWPALLLLLTAASRRLLLASLLLAVSLWATLWYRDSMTDAVFYLLPFRIHQLMAGAVVAMLSLRLLGLAGNLVIVLATAGLVALFVVMEDGYSPAVGAVWVSGLGFMLLLGRDARLARKVYGWRPMLWLGQRSYAIYLVHWPIIVLYLFATDFSLAPGERLLLFCASLIAAMVLHEAVEKPFRKRGEDTTRLQRLAFPLSLGGLVLTVILAGVTAKQEGFSSRGTAVIQAMVDSVPRERAIRHRAIRHGQCHLNKIHNFEDYDEQTCATAQPGKVNIAIIGDSMGADIYHILSLAYPEINFLQATAGGCPGLLDKRSFGSDYPSCSNLNGYRFSEMLEQDIDLVVLASIWKETRVPALSDTVAYVQGRGMPVLVFGPKMAYHGRVPLLLAKETSLHGVNTRLAKHVETHRQTLAAMRKALPGENVIDMYTIQCEPDCIAIEGEQLLYTDAIHLTVLGARRMAERFRDRYDLAEFW